MEKSDTSQTNKIIMKKPKKKQQINSELDRQKQAEKKKRRLEKALATSAAIISELEKKKQIKKLEEQKRLETEGAHISEAVALNVLLESDQDPIRMKKPKKNQEINSELDRQRQDEKKKRRLEKALATSANIISDLEKKKQKNKEQQQEEERLDKEGAHIAESVALNVLIEEDQDLVLGPTRLGRPVIPVWESELEISSWGGLEWGTGGVQLFPFVWGEIEFCPALAVSSLQIREDSEFNLLQGV